MSRACSSRSRRPATSSGTSAACGPRTTTQRRSPASAKCKEIALDQIAQGSKVVFQVAGQCGLGALDAAKEEGVQGIGVDADQAYLGEHVLTSALKKVDVAIFDAIKRVQEGKFKGGDDVIATVKSGGVGIGKISPAGQKYADQIKEVQDKLASGEIPDIPDTVK